MHRSGQALRRIDWHARWHVETSDRRASGGLNRAPLRASLGAGDRRDCERRTRVVVPHNARARRGRTVTPATRLASRYLQDARTASRPRKTTAGFEDSRARRRDIRFVSTHLASIQRSSLPHLDNAGATPALRTTVALGRASVNTIEVKGGLSIGDSVIISDMSQFDATNRVRIK